MDVLTEAPAVRPEFDDARTRKALEGFFAIMTLWGADARQMRRILGSPPERTFYAWKAGQARRVPEDLIRQALDVRRRHRVPVGLDVAAGVVRVEVEDVHLEVVSGSWSRA